MEFILIFLIIVLIVLISFVILVFIFVIIPFLMLGASFEVTDNKSIKKMIKLSRVKTNEKVAELGSGNGKIVVEFAEAGAEAHGYEINPLLVLYSRRKIKKLNLQNRAFIHWKNFWNVNLKNFDVIIFFQYKHLMRRLEKKLKRELRPKTRIISNKWKFPNLKYEKKQGEVYLYKI